MRNETKTNISKIGWIGAFVVFISVAAYAMYLRDATLTNTGQFGDSFGILTCLFSGLSSVGMIVAILMQREELELQREELQKNREEFEKSAKAQENNVKLSALMAIWQEDKNKIVRNDESIANFKKIDDLGVCFDEEDYALNNKCTQQNKTLKNRREVIFTEIEKILRESGIAIPEMPMD